MIISIYLVDKIEKFCKFNKIPVMIEEVSDLYEIVFKSDKHHNIVKQYIIQTR